jgi:hypothetical protein
MRFKAAGVPRLCFTYNTRNNIPKEETENVVLFLMTFLCILIDDSCLFPEHFQPEIWRILNIKGNIPM